MYSYEDRLRAVKLYHKRGRRMNATLRQLGYPSKNSLKAWCAEFSDKQDLRAGYRREKRQYNEEQEHRELGYFGALYELERLTQEMDYESRRRIRQERSKPVADALYAWMRAQRERVPEGSATAKALDYWVALTRYLDDGALPIDNKHIENQIRPIAIGRSNWLFAGSLRAGKRAAAVMTLIQSARLNGLDPYAYVKDVLTRLPTQPTSDIHQLLPHHWTPATE